MTDATAMKTYSEQISDYIKRALRNGHLKPGDKVNEVRLATELSISRAPVREGLQMLVKEGLIVSIPQRGKFIIKLSAKDIRDSYSMGGVLEGAAVAESSAFFTEEDFAALELSLAQLAELDASAPDYAESFARLDISFHETLLAKAENKLMVEQARTVCQRISKFLLFRYWPYAYTHAEVFERHHAVLQAVRSRSRTEIERAIRVHYTELGERMARFGCDSGGGF